MQNNQMTKKIYTILELNNEIRRVINSEFPEYVWVCGEIKDLRNSPSRFKKHVYFNLAQKHPEADELLAQTGAALFENNRKKIERQLEVKDIYDFLKNDLEVKLLCKVNFYPKMGRFSLIIVNIDPAYTLGKLAQSRQKILQELKKKGIIEKNKTLTKVPAVPLKIGLITAHNSAAFHDFINELEKSGFGFKILLADSHMQGKKTEKDISEALRFFNSLPPEKIDVIAVTRGGGGQADLGWFDSKQLALEVSKSKQPVLSAIGHQINLSILEIVSHEHFKTPTGLAQFIIEKNREFLDTLDTLYTNLNQKIEPLINNHQRKLEMTTSRILNHIHIYFKEHKDYLTKYKTLLQSESKKHLKKQTEIVNNAVKELNQYTKNNLRDKKRNLKSEEEKIKILDPINTLKRGFSVSLKNKKAIKDTNDIKKGDTIETILYKGKIDSKVI